MRRERRPLKNPSFEGSGDEGETHDYNTFYLAGENPSFEGSGDEGERRVEGATVGLERDDSRRFTELVERFFESDPHNEYAPSDWRRGARSFARWLDDEAGEPDISAFRRKGEEQ